MTAPLALAVAVIALAIALPALWRSTRALRVTADHEEALRLAARETPMEALVDVVSAPAAWGREPCGCYWLEPGSAEADPVWNPCNEHVDRLLRAVLDEGGEL